MKRYLLLMLGLILGMILFLFVMPGNTYMDGIGCVHYKPPFAFFGVKDCH